ncbi:MAG: hypothetical protein JNM56_03285 [Planctomycetia bacterium]|nr:hypothetical protein [Planctomycetia bacterium]
MPDLITNARARINLPSAVAGDDTAINTMIAAASRAIQRYCRRDFVSTSYDELYHGSGQARLLLRQYPVLSIQAVRCRLATVLTVINSNLTLNQLARISVTATGLSLVRTASGVSTTDTITFAANVTLSALAAAVNALGNGWAAQVIADYGSWPSADLRGPQGAMQAWGQVAELKLHTATLADYQLDERRGWLLHPGSMWPVGRQQFRVQYTAGYATVPEDVQEACAELTATWFLQRGRDLSLRREDTAGTYRFEATDSDQLPKRIRALLRPYRYHRVLSEQG